LIVDASYELPIAYKVTRASRPDIKEMLPLIKGIKRAYPEVEIDTLSGDKAYDSRKELKSLWDDYMIKPVIDIRNQWKDGEETHPLFPDRIDNIVYDYKGTVYCHPPATSDHYEMAFCGLEKDRNTLKYRCPAAAYGLSCTNRDQCGSNTPFGRIVRIPLEIDRRIFTPIARSSYRWKNIYAGRTAVERVNSRIDHTNGFEHHFIRGKAKMTLKAGLALVVMLSMALARIRHNQKEMMCSLVAKVA